MTLASHRLVNLAGVAWAVTAMLVAVLWMQYTLKLEPCPLCMIDRVLVCALGSVFLIAALHNPGIVGQRLYATLNLLLAGAGIAVCARHIWLQGLPEDLIPACAPGLDYMLETLPWLQILKVILNSSGECAKIDFVFMGLTLPKMTLLVFTGFAGMAGLQWCKRAV